MYNTCIKLDTFADGGNIAWCSTQINSKGEHVYGSEGECNLDCRVSNCPLGFYWTATEDTCYQVTTVVQRHKMVTNFMNLM